MYREEVNKLLPGDIDQLTSDDTLQPCDKLRVVIILAKKLGITEHEAIKLIKKSDMDNPFHIDNEVFIYMKDSRSGE